MKYDSVAKSRYNYRLNYIYSSTVTSVTSSRFLSFFFPSFLQKNHPNPRYTTLRDEKWNELLVPFWKVTTSTWPVRSPGVNSPFFLLKRPTFSTFRSSDRIVVYLRKAKAHGSVVEGWQDIGRRGWHTFNRLVQQIHGEPSVHQRGDEIVVGHEARVQGPVGADVRSDHPRSTSGHLS